MKNTFFFISISMAILFFISNRDNLYSQTKRAESTYNRAFGTEEWALFMDGNNDTDYVNAIGVDNVGNVYIGGSQKSNISNYDFVIAKFNEHGSEIWKKTYNGSGNMVDKLVGLIVDKENNIYVSGWTFENGSFYDITTIKYNSSGEIIWEVKFNGIYNGNDIGGKLAIDNKGNIFVVGMSNGGVVIKYDSSGIEQWTKYFESNYPSSCITDYGGNIIVTGSMQFSEKNTNFITVKYDEYGNEKWKSIYDGSGPGFTLDYSWETPNDICVDFKGNVYVTGQSIGNKTGWDYVTVKYNSEGEQKWVKRHSGIKSSNDESDQDIPEAIEADSEGNVYVTGESSFSKSDYDYLTIKYDSIGTEIWKIRNDANNASDWAEDLILDFYGNCYVTGQQYTGNDNSNCKITTIKYNGAGDKEWIANFTSNRYNIFYGQHIIIDNIGNIYVASDCKYGENPSDITLLKYSKATYKSNDDLSKMYEVFTNKIISLRRKFESEIKKMEKDFKEKGEFETSEAFSNREKDKFIKANIIEKEYSIEIKKAEEQRDIAINDFRKTKKTLIFKSIEQSRDTIFKISNVNSYNADKQTFEIKINGIIKNVFVPISKAPKFKENWKKAKVKCKKQLMDDMKTYQFFDFIIVDPDTGDEYLFEEYKKN